MGKGYSYHRSQTFRRLQYFLQSNKPLCGFTPKGRYHMPRPTTLKFIECPQSFTVECKGDNHLARGNFQTVRNRTIPAKEMDPENHVISDTTNKQLSLPQRV